MELKYTNVELYELIKKQVLDNECYSFRKVVNMAQRMNIVGQYIKTADYFEIKSFCETLALKHEDFQAKICELIQSIFFKETANNGVKLDHFIISEAYEFFYDNIDELFDEVWDENRDEIAKHFIPAQNGSIGNYSDIRG